MARFGKLPVILPEGVQAEITNSAVTITGPKGTLSRDLPRLVSVTKEDGTLTVKAKNDSKPALSLQGTIRSHMVNMVKGVTEEWSKQLEVVGAGYKAELQGNKLILTVGYSHPVTIEAPLGVSFKVEKLIITVSGADKEAVGHIAAQIHAAKPPEPYKGTGIRYSDEVVRRKAGKQAAKGA